MMTNTPTGTYLVRDSTNKDENAPYTLTLRYSQSFLVLFFIKRETCEKCLADLL